MLRRLRPLSCCCKLFIIRPRPPSPKYNGWSQVLLDPLMTRAKHAKVAAKERCPLNAVSTGLSFSSSSCPLTQVLLDLLMYRVKHTEATEAAHLLLQNIDDPRYSPKPKLHTSLLA